MATKLKGAIKGQSLRIKCDGLPVVPHYDGRSQLMVDARGEIRDDEGRKWRVYMHIWRKLAGPDVLRAKRHLVENRIVDGSPILL